MKYPMSDERGFAMIAVLSILMMIGILGISMVGTSTQEMNISDNFKRDTQALYAAEAGAEVAYTQFKAAIDATNRPPDPLPDGTLDFNRHTVTYRIDHVAGPTQRTLSSGTYRGLRALVNDYDIWGHAASNATAVQNSVRVRMEQALIPIFQFAIFYEDDLEWHPGPVMTLSGRVHSNANLYLGSNSGLTVRSFVTAANEIRHGRHPASGQSSGNGRVSIEDAQGVAQNMENPTGGWLDHSDADWLTKSMDRWDGQVQDVAHGVTRLEIPLETGGGPISIIKGAPGGNLDSYERKATLKMVDGQAYTKVGVTWTNVTANMIADGTISTATFYDAREGKNVSSLEIDVSQLNNSPYWPDNGILYTRSTVGTFPATRLVNGTELKDGLTVVSENPIYTQGNY
ncbi:MAG TPA: pilus assembly PilX N-terminal domain-containing protein, partial [Acidobacteriota bacterium]|nr:pilus assembly PilX N-terminal domain-containing protein [Acidobacteriota bacterium]